MEYLRQTIDIIWNRLDVNHWIDSFFTQLDWREETFIDKAFVCNLVDVYSEITLDQADAVRELIHKKWMCHVNDKKLSITSPHKTIGRVANVLIHFVCEVLVQEQGMPRCKYPKLLKWYDVYQSVGDDMLTCAFLAYDDLQKGIPRTSYLWPMILPHTNNELNAICDKGMSELHFHLKGSSLNFDLQWLSLMNDILNRKKAFERLSAMPKGINLLQNQRTLYELILIAAYCRFWLFTTNVIAKNTKPIDYKLLQAPQLFQLQIQDWINECKIDAYRFAKSSTNKRVIDYAISSKLQNTDSLKYINSILSGERDILYSSFKTIYSGDSNATLCSYMLMIYTMIKCRLRQELIQINSRKGFANFSHYQQEKELFIKKGSVYESLVEDLSLKATCCNQPIKYIEYRITPKKDPNKLIHYIYYLKQLSLGHKNSSYIHNKAIENRMRQISAFAILHFIKQKFPSKDNHIRNKKLRLKVKNEAIAICKAYNRFKVFRDVVCAIDAANSERYARPEVFAQAFRFLRGELSRYYDDNEKNSLGFTYHVGEDFWDIIDGLRSIDETILFLEMREGDRIGHAMALGINAEQYYTERHMNVVMPKQIFIDNLVWIYFKLQYYNISLPPILDKYIQDKVYEYIPELYKDSMTHSVQMTNLYRAWLLRGNGIDMFGDDDRYIGWDKYKKYKLEDVYVSLKMDTISSELNSVYQINEKAGDEMCFEKLPYCIIPIVTQLQECMRKDIENKHIAIESNLTSNLRIGEFTRFDEHPILKFNKDFLDDECSNSMLVSINTDDQGVFATSITNEYALMACAIEKIRDSHDNYKYRPIQINRWLNNIREMTESQRFRK